MYEHQTFQNILKRMIDRVPNDIDKREGSILYDALAPAAAELAQAYAELDVNLNLFSAQTSSGVYLDLRASDYGVTRKKATKAIRKGLFYGNGNVPRDVPVGSRFSIAGLGYVVLKRIAVGQFELECETVGTVGNRQFGTLLPVEYVDGLVRAEIADVLIPGEDDETDDSLRERYFQRVQSPSTSGNKYDYMNWALEFPGVGGVQVLPLWNGPGTVKVVLLDTEKRAPSSDVVESVQNYIDPQTGEGEGKAPIGAQVTVTAAEEIPISIDVQLTLASGASLSEVQEMIENGTREYLKGLAFKDPIVRYTRIASILLDIPPITDFSDLLVNGVSNQNIEILPGQVAVLGTVTVYE